MQRHWPTKSFRLAGLLSAQRASQLQSIYSRFRSTLQVHAYTPFTIAAYLRKSGTEIGEGCWIVPTSFGTEPYLVRIGNHVAIAEGVSFMTHDGGPWIFRDRIPDLQVLGPIVVCDNCYIGARAIIGPNVRIGPNSVVMAGSVVISDVPPNTLVLGVPARPLLALDKFRQQCMEQWSVQRPPDGNPSESSSSERMKNHLLTVFRNQLSAIGFQRSAFESDSRKPKAES